MAVWMMRCRLLLQKLTGHISEVSNQNKLNFGLVWFPYGPNMCANFQRNLRGWRFFFVDLVWNDPIVRLFSIGSEPIIVVRKLVAISYWIVKSVLLKGQNIYLLFIYCYILGRWHAYAPWGWIAPHGQGNYILSFTAQL